MGNNRSLAQRAVDKDKRVVWLMTHLEEFGLRYADTVDLGRFTINPTKRQLFTRMQRVGLFAPTSDCTQADLRSLVQEARRRLLLTAAGV